MKKSIAVLLIIALFVGIMPGTGVSAKVSYVKLVKKSAVLSIMEDDSGIVFETAKIKIKTMYGARVTKVSYCSKNRRIASVSAKGKVKAMKQGSTYINVTVKYKSKGKKYVKRLPFAVEVVETKEFDFPDDTDIDEQFTDEAETDLDNEQILFPTFPVQTNNNVIANENLSEKPNAEPTDEPITEPTAKPTEEPTAKPTEEPTAKPTEEPAAEPTAKPTAEPAAEPTAKPAVKPTAKPTAEPVIKPTAKPTVKPTVKPTAKPTMTPMPYKVISDGTYKFNTAIKSNMMLDAVGNETKNGTNIQIHQNNETNAQRFKITHLGSGWYKICHVSSGKSLDVTGAVKKPGINVQLYTYNGTDAQLWRFHAAENGFVYIQNKLGYYLDVDGAKTANETNVIVYTKNGTKAQKWKPIKIVFPAGISLGSGGVTLSKIGETKKLSAVFAPANTTQKGLTWSSSDEKVVTVTNGTVKAVGSGTAVITAKTENGKTATKKITVKDGCVTVDTGWYCFNTKAGSNFMLDVKGNGASNGSNIQIYQKNGSAAQKFYVEHVGNGWHLISNTFPKRCLDVQGGSDKSGANVQLYMVNNSDAQKWRFYFAGDGYYTIMNKSGCYLDVYGGTAKNNTNVQIHTYNGTNAQRWKLISIKQEYANIANSLYSIKTQVGNNMALDVFGNRTADGTNIQIYQSNNSVAQKFCIQSTGDGWFKISNPLSGKCLDVQGGLSKSGTNVQLYSYNGSDAQKWRFYQEGDCFAIKNKLGCYLDVDGGKNKNGTNVLVYTKNGTKAQKWKIAETSAIILNPSGFTLDGVGKTRDISVSYEPAYVFDSNRKIEWSTSNSGVATVSNGTVQAVGVGKATITAQAFNGQKYTVTVEVKIDNGQIILNVPSYKQTDPSWCNTYIGTKTIGRIGCLLTSLSMKYSYHKGIAMYPNNMKSKLKFSNNDIIWSSVKSLGYEYSKEYRTGITNEIMKIIYNKLKNKKPVIIGGVKSNGSMHWIIIKGYKGKNSANFSSSDFLVNDPNNTMRQTLNQFLSTYPTVLRLIY